MKPVTLFDSPQWPLLPDPEHRWYANVDNRLEIAQRSKTKFVTVAIPTGLFTLMKSVCNVSTTESCTLAIDEYVSDSEEPRYLLSMHVTGGVEDRLYDLWTYSRGSLPQWML